jgi:hypothetical protein
MGYFLVQTILFIVLFSLFFIDKDSLNEKEINFIFTSLIIYIGINFLNIVVHLCTFNSISKSMNRDKYWFMKIKTVQPEYLIIYIVKMISMIFILYLFSYILFNKKVNINSNALKVLLPILLTLLCLFLQRLLYFLASYSLIKFEYDNIDDEIPHKSFPSLFFLKLFGFDLKNPYYNNKNNKNNNNKNNNNLFNYNNYNY